jgi:hypothetical protein
MKKIWILSCCLFGLNASAQSIVTSWNFNSTVNDANVATGVLTSAIGTGTATAVGGINQTYATGYLSDLNLTDNSGMQTTNYPAAGTNPKTAGVQFDVNAAGFNRLILEFYQRLSNTSANTWTLQYTLDKTGVSTGGTVQWTDATTWTFTPAATGTGDIWYFRSYDFSTVTGLSNNANAGFRVVSNFDPTTGNYLASRSTSTYSTSGTSRFDLVTIRESAGTASIVAASNAQYASETSGTINVPVTFANANNASAKVKISVSSYSDATLNSDYSWALTDTLTIPALFNGVTNFGINILNDVLSERTEKLIVKMTPISNANISTADYYQIIYIKDNDYVSPVPNNELYMTLLSSFSNGAAPANSAEIVAYDSTNYRLYIANSIGAKLDIVDFSNPSAPVLLNSVSVAPYGNINSVTAHNGIVALAIENAVAQQNGSVVFLNSSGTFLNQVTVGAMPDMITFNRDFTKVLTANEGEPSALYSVTAANNTSLSVDPEGSVSIIDLTPGVSSITNANVTTIGLTQYNGQEATLRAQGIRVFSSSATVAQDLEPEYISVSGDNSKAYVTIQEANAMLVIDLLTSTIDTLYALGFSNYSSGNGMDASDQTTGQILITSLPVKGAYMPDAIASSTINGQEYVFMANEGDSREFGGVIDANRISTLALDSTVWTDQAIVKNSKFMGRLSGLKYSGDTDNDGDLDEIHVMGGRSFSIRNASTGALVYDSKDLIERITSTHPVYAALFNASNAIGTPAIKNRSDDKGPEPEGVTTAFINGSHYLFVGLERIGGAMVFNVDNPVNPVYVGYYNNRSTTASGPDLGTEGIIYIDAAHSPNGQSILILANEVSSTLSIYQVNTCAEIAGAEINSTDTEVCEGETVAMNISGSPSTTIQWLQNGQSLTGANGLNITASTSGDYQVVIESDVYACTDTSNVQTLVVHALPVVSATASDYALCIGDSVTVYAEGASIYAWTNAVTENVPFAPQSSSEYLVTGTDVNGCQDTSLVSIAVAELPLVSANATDTVICYGESVVFYGSGAATYSWNNAVSNGIGIVLNPSTTTYTVVGTSASGCTSSDSILVTVNPTPVIDLGADTTVCSYNLPITLNGPAGFATYQWNTGSTSSTANAPGAGNYQLTVTNEFGCTDNDIVAVISDACLGIEDNEQALLNAYPNPSKGMFTISHTMNGTSMFVLMDAQGRSVLQFSNNLNEFTLDLSNYSSGVYTLMIQGTEITTVRIIKE